MSSGGLFVLLANTGKQDELLLATDLLNKRLREIERIRCKHPAIRDSTPTLVDIERTHVLFLNSHYRPFCSIGFEYNHTAPQEGRINFGQQVTFSIPQFGDFYSDMALHVTMSNLLPGAGATQVRYCDFPGHRLLQNTRFEVNGNFIDQYDTNVYNFHYGFMVPTDKRIGWQRNVGQEIPAVGYLTNNPGIDNYRQLLYFANGPQTPQATQPFLEMWIPLLFWFNLDSRLSIPSVAIPYGQRFIRIDIAPAELICQGVSIPPATSIAFIPPSIDTFDLYINNIFINPEIHDIFIKRIGFNLIRVHRIHIEDLQPFKADDLLLQELRWPIETIYLGVIPDTVQALMVDWWRYSNFTPHAAIVPVVCPSLPPTVVPGAVFFNTYGSILNTFQVRIHGVNIFQDTPTSFFNSYLPYTYGAHTINTPEDLGMYMMNFNLYPGTFQPSGHINLSRAREFYFSYTTNLLFPDTNPQLIAIGIAINFLLISDGSAVLRYNI